MITQWRLTAHGKRLSLQLPITRCLKGLQEQLASVSLRALWWAEKMIVKGTGRFISQLMSRGRSPQSSDLLTRTNVPPHLHLIHMAYLTGLWLTLGEIILPCHPVCD